jgi:phenylpropionate dioxygenase-like ring-hydroxylating dioxygenase large terminal subunit
MDDTTSHGTAHGAARPQPSGELHADPGTLAAGQALPGWCYTSPGFFRAEIEHIHRRTWIFAGRADELQTCGDYRTIDTVGGPLILLRDGDGTLRAFANCCRHRGSLLLTGTGNAQAIVCPYHAWSYQLDGTLLAAPAMGRVPGFDKDAHALAPVRLETWQGFIFVNFDSAAPPLREHLGNLPEVLGSYRFDDMLCTWRAEITCRCNWKLLVENALEAYHTASVHAATVGSQREDIIPTRGEWVCLQVLNERSIAVLTDQPPFPPIDGLDEQARKGTYFTMILPTTQFACAQDAMWWLAMRPLAVDCTVLSLGGCFPRSTVARPDFAANAQAYYDRWRRVAEEDVGILEGQQQGLGSILYAPGRLSSRDALVSAVDTWVLARIPQAERHG